MMDWGETLILDEVSLHHAGLLYASNGLDSSVPDKRWKEWMPTLQFQQTSTFREFKPGLQRLPGVLGGCTSGGRDNAISWKWTAELRQNKIPLERTRPSRRTRGGSSLFPVNADNRPARDMCLLGYVSPLESSFHCPSRPLLVRLGAGIMRPRHRCPGLVMPLEGQACRPYRVVAVAPLQKPIRAKKPSCTVRTGAVSCAGNGFEEES